MTRGISLGDHIPSVTVRMADETPLNLADLGGTPLVLYFYPKADTAGCTREAQDFSGALDAFRQSDTQVIGLSRDTPARLARFATKQSLGVPLASDEDGTACEAFGVWVEKQMYGKTHMGIERSTFLFNSQSVLIRIWRKVRVPGHVDNVLMEARSIPAE